jgi:hypothetical protein
MCIVPSSPVSTTTATPGPRAAFARAAEQLNPQQRQQIARDVLAGRSISELARTYNVSRKFIRSLRSLALDALDRAFAPHPAAPHEVLFFLPVTQDWLQQLALALILTCHSSLRGVHEILRDLFDYPLSIGSIHNIVGQAIAKASVLNSQQDLGCVLVAALDEIFQGNRPILSVVDVFSTYCCLLSLEEHRDGDTWGVRLLELQEQGFSPLETIGDGGKGLRSGVTQVLGGTCRADVFHAERDLGLVVRFLENRAYAAITACDKLQRQVEDNQRRGISNPELRKKRDAAASETVRAIALAEDVAVLACWLRQDVLSVAGPRLAERQELFDFVASELKALEPLCPHRLGPVCQSLANQKAALLAFVEQLDRDIGDLAAWARIPQDVVREMMAVQEMPQSSARRWQRDRMLHQQLGERYHEVSQYVESLRGGVVRASSVVENVNSRLRNYFFLRKEVGQGYLELLRFFLNHRRFLRSEHPERVGKSPAELLSREEHGHWLEMLGHQLFRRTA